MIGEFNLRDLTRRRGPPVASFGLNRTHRHLSFWLAVAERSATRPMARMARPAAGSPPRIPARCDPRITRPRRAAASSARRSLPSAAPRILATVCRIPASPGSAAAADNHPGTASNDCTTYPEARYRWRRHCRELEANCVSAWLKIRHNVSKILNVSFA